MNIDEAIEEARRFSEQEPKDMLFAEHISIVLAAEIERLRAELAAAKAASVCPVKIHGCFYSVAFDHFGLSSEDARRFDDWLRDRVEERGER